MHHIDIHVRDLRGPKRLFGALAPLLGYGVSYEDDDFIGYASSNGGQPRFGIIRDEEHTPGSMRVAFSLPERSAVDAAALAAREHGAQKIDGPAVHDEYGDDYYAVFFEDDQGNKFEIVAAAASA